MQRKIDARRLTLIAALSLAGAGAWQLHSQRELLEGVSVAQTTLGRVDGRPIVRSERPEARFEVVLENAPQGQSLELHCDWTDPSFEVAQENHWQTGTINKARWPTHCRRTFAPRDLAGEWSVTMSLGERTLATVHLTVQ